VIPLSSEFRKMPVVIVQLVINYANYLFR